MGIADSLGHGSSRILPELPVMFLKYVSDSGKSLDSQILRRQKDSAP